jgi:hypothetical protein
MTHRRLFSPEIYLDDDVSIEAEVGAALIAKRRWDNPVSSTFEKDRFVLGVRQQLSVVAFHWNGTKRHPPVGSSARTSSTARPIEGAFDVCTYVADDRSFAASAVPSR